MSFDLKRIALIVILSFSAGIMIGAWLGRPAFSPRWKDKNPEKMMLERYSSKLHLSAEQKTNVEKILNEARPKMIALRSETRPKFEAIRSSVNSQIRSLLNDRQKSRFDKMEAEWEARMKNFHHGRPHP